MATTSSAFDTQHQDMIHDAQMDYYGKRLATCSSDRTIRLFDVQGDKQTLIESLHGHDGPVWQVAWAHPRFGPILASCSYDGRVIIWKEIEGEWVRVKEHQSHTSSVNSIAWAPQELGPILACASSDGYVSILTFNAEEGAWANKKFMAHKVGVNAISWCSPVQPGTLLQGNSTTAPNTVKRLATVLEHHTEWVRDVAFAPNFGLSKTLLASCSQDKTVVIATHDAETNTWTKTPLKEGKFPDVVWRVSWSLTGNILAVSCGDNKITVWKQNLKGAWECVEELQEKV
ncbi:WD40-repeat-containing domain protein [Dimargaris cristalligena]|uniref:WD40-repeat-containing domain protein n=1 Tax=Dimargaris cristalligena TaxID=215637 RepID=A0A4P9ZSI7_9FUNG|nr:WD40-repeat-containing domain protein [Dimargaris cristalligena]|eukprot:RKP36397.1 WD40-repeat-containing domain protein [Dimargaris cristalligena]